MNTSDEIIKILQDLSGKQEIHDEDSLQETVGLDSLGLVSMLIELEEAFEIELNESDMNPFDLVTVSDVKSLVERYIGDPNEKDC